MSKASKLKFVFAGNIPKAKKEEKPVVIEPAEEEIVNDPGEPLPEDTGEETVYIPDEPTTDTAEPEKVHSNTEIDYGSCTVPMGKAKDNGIVLCVILCILLLLCLSVLIYQNVRNSSPVPDNNENVIEPEYKELITIIKGYVASIKDPRKAEFCEKLRQHYIEAANEPVTDINVFLENNLEKTRIILGFYGTPAISNEYEWFKLFCKGGIIDKWLEKSEIVITPVNKKALFLAIAEGLN